jgi:hypothetical protein
MDKMKIVLVCLWIALGISVFYFNDLYYSEALVGFYVIDKIIDVLRKDYK